MKSINNLKSIISFAFFAMFFASPAWSQALGGMQKAIDTGTMIKVALYALVGILGLIYLCYLAAMAFTEKKTWADFGWGVVHVSVAGAALPLGTWAWTIFQ